MKKNNGSETITIKYFSMFSGIGGFEYGLQQSKHDFENVGFSEIDKYAVSIYERHYPNHTNYGDATKIKTEDLPDFEFLVGGFPCQAFSVAGKRKGFDDTRGTLFFEIARVLKDKRPRYFLLENVKGLLSHNKGETFQTILEVLSDLGYYVQWTVLNSADFQVPQRRERVFIEGYLGGESTGEVLSVRRNCSKNITKVNSFRDTHRSFSVYPDTNTKTVRLRESTRKGYKDVKVGDGIELSRSHCNIRRGVSHEDATGTLNTQEGSWGTLDKDYRIRKLTPRECERLQAFPDDWTKYGKDGELISDTQRYKCCGNAVTTTVITAIVDEMFDKVKK